MAWRCCAKYLHRSDRDRHREARLTIGDLIDRRSRDGSGSISAATMEKGHDGVEVGDTRSVYVVGMLLAVSPPRRVKRPRYG